MSPAHCPNRSTAPIRFVSVAFKEVHQVLTSFADFHFLDQPLEPNQKPIIPPSIAISSVEKIMSDDKHDINLECSFCGKKRNDVRKLIAGPDAYICNECVSISNKIINEEFYDDDLGIFDEENIPLLTTVPVIIVFPSAPAMSCVKFTIPKLLNPLGVIFR